MIAPLHNSGSSTPPLSACGDDTSETRQVALTVGTELTLQEKARLATQAKTMTETLLEATDLLGGMQWCLVHDKHGVSLFRADVQMAASSAASSISTATSTSTAMSATSPLAPCNVHAVSKFNADIEAVAASMITSTTEAYKKMMRLLSSDFVNGAVLHKIVEPSEANPHRFVALKWAAFKSASPFSKDHDCIILEYVDMIEDDQGQKVAFRVMQSVDLPHHAELAPSAKYTRDIVPLMGFMYHTTKNPGELRMTYTCNFSCDDDLPAWAANSAIQSHVEKAINGVLKYIETFRATLDEQELVLPQQVIPMNEQDFCRLCEKNFCVLRRRHSCLKCGENICSSCSALRTTKVPDVGERQLRVCTACVLAARRIAKQQQTTSETCASPMSGLASGIDSDARSVSSDTSSFHHRSRRSCDDPLDHVRSRLIEYKNFADGEGMSIPRADFPGRSFSDGLVSRKGSLFRSRRRGSPADLAISLEAFRQHQLRMGNNNDPQQPEDNDISDDESAHSVGSFSSSASSCCSAGTPSMQELLSSLSTNQPANEDALTMRLKALAFDKSPSRRRRHAEAAGAMSRAQLDAAMERSQSIMEAATRANSLAQQARKISHHRVIALQREHQALMGICGVDNQADENDSDNTCGIAVARMHHPSRQVSDGVMRYGTNHKSTA